MVNGFVSAIFIKTINFVGEPLDHHLKDHLKQLSMSNEKGYFGYKGGCGILVIKEELAWSIDKQFQFISNVILLI